ncbi:MAG: type II toxin-antitoxin system VapB family antitoxin [Spirochaetaceae bacterium]|nr:MAG: type II toxin-antitoxin system VapB family antitoxin [Spirochaetaceae bacterium]
MKTTLDIDKNLVGEAMREYGVTTKTRIVEMGLRELIRAARRRRLAASFGSQPDLDEPRRRRPG